MSRSYRHTPMASIRRKEEKRFANRRVRRTNAIFSNGEYRKVYPSDFIGYSCYWANDDRRK